jgi:hypothetical protein
MATSAKDTDISGKATTLGSSANPSGASKSPTGYIKLRTNSDWVFTVKSGYKVTGIKIVAYQHDNNDGTTATIDMTSIMADGGSNLLSSTVSMPQKKVSTNTVLADIADLNATSNITVKFSNSVPTTGDPKPQTQCYAIVTLAYEKIETGIEVVNAATNVKAETPAYYYNLQGQRVAPGTKGIVIYKGMKFFNP